MRGFYRNPNEKDAGLNWRSGRRERELRRFQTFNRGRQALLKDWMEGCGGGASGETRCPIL